MLDNDQKTYSVAQKYIKALFSDKNYHDSRLRGGGGRRTLSSKRLLKKSFFIWTPSLTTAAGSDNCLYYESWRNTQARNE